MKEGRKEGMKEGMNKRTNERTNELMVGGGFDGFVISYQQPSERCEWTYVHQPNMVMFISCPDAPSSIYIYAALRRQ